MSENPTQTTVTVYTREDCHLCEEALKTIRRTSEEMQKDVSLDLVDIDETPELREQYGDRIPYVLIDGRPAFKYRVDKTALRERLSAE